MEAEVTAGDFLVSQLLRPQAYPHPVDLVQLRETHISWVFLTGQFAYKVKKPVNFGFVDFSTPAARHYYCREELARNRSFAAGLYLTWCPSIKRIIDWSWLDPAKQWTTRSRWSSLTKRCWPRDC